MYDAKKKMQNGKNGLNNLPLIVMIIMSSLMIIIPKSVIL